MEINGVAHVMLTVSNYEVCVPFYEKLLPFLGLTHVVRKTDSQFYCIGGRTGLGIHRGDSSHRGKRFEQGRVGLHHLCFRTRERKDVDDLYQLLQSMGAKIIHAPEVGSWAPGYYSILFEDPDGIRLEVSHLPGKGLLASPRQELSGKCKSKDVSLGLCGVDGETCPTVSRFQNRLEIPQSQKADDRERRAGKIAIPRPRQSELSIRSTANSAFPLKSAPSVIPKEPRIKSNCSFQLHSVYAVFLRDQKQAYGISLA